MLECNKTIPHLPDRHGMSDKELSWRITKIRTMNKINFHFSQGKAIATNHQHRVLCRKFWFFFRNFLDSCHQFAMSLIQMHCILISYFIYIATMAAMVEKWIKSIDTVSIDILLFYFEYIKLNDVSDIVYVVFMRSSIPFLPCSSCLLSDGLSFLFNPCIISYIIILRLHIFLSTDFPSFRGYRRAYRMRTKRNAIQ